jgi:hypothetical protein
VSLQGLRQQSFRTYHGASGNHPYEADLMLAFAADSISTGTFNERLLAWINLQLGVTYTDLPSAQHAYAVAKNIAGGWSALGTFAPNTVPAYANVGTVSTSPSGTTLNVGHVNPLPAANDLLIMQASSDNDSALTIVAGWTAFSDQVNVSTTYAARLWWKRATGTESGTVTVTRATGSANATFVAVMSHFTSVRTTGLPYEGLSAASGTSTNFVGPAVVASGRTRLACTYHQLGDNLTSTPSGVWTERYDAALNVGDGAQLVLDTAPATNETIAAASRTVGASHPFVGFGFCLIPA